jgi:2Fe-2S ferredoxin
MDQPAGRRPIVRVEPQGIEIEVRPGETLIEAAWREGYDWPTVCYGQAQCTACHVRMLDGWEHVNPVQPEEEVTRRRLTRTPNLDEIRLACRLEVSGPVRVEKPNIKRASG